MKIKNIIVWSLATVCLSSCKGLYGTYNSPDINTSNIIRNTTSSLETPSTIDSTMFGYLPWNKVFTDPLLQRLIETGLKNNPDLLNAALNVKMAEAQLQAAKLAFVPSFTFSPSGTISSWDGGKATKTYSLPISANWSIDLFGNLLSQKRSSQMALLATKDYQLVVKTKLISNISNMYYTLLMLDEELKVLTDMENLTQETWGLMKVMKDKNGYRSASVQSAEANYLSVLAQKEDLKRQISETENSLSLILGEPAGSITRGLLKDQSLPSDLASGINVQMLNNRPDVHYAEMSLAQCFYNVETARSKFYPSITISPSGAFTNSGTLGIVNPGKWLLSAVGSLTQPIFQHGQLIAGLKVAKAQYEQALNTWKNAILSAGSEVSNALVLYNSSNEKAQIEEKQIKALKQNVEDTRILMKLSGSTYLEVITAQQNLLNAQLSLIQDEFYKMQAVVNLYYALGGGIN